MSNCISCKKQTDKYKCPSCLQFYCSVQCFREHKSNSDSCAPKSNTVPTKNSILENEPAVRDPFTTEDTVSQAELERLKNCDALKNLLYNKHLRNLLLEINVANNAHNAMQAAMQEPLFLEFADECLKIIEPNEGGNSNET